VGYLADKVDLRFVFFAVAIAHSALLLLYVMEPSYWLLLGLATVFGIGIGGVFPVWTTLIAWLFGSKSYGTIMGLMTIPMKVVSVVTVRMVGEIHDRTGSYSAAFLIFAGATVVAMILVSMIRPPQREKPLAPEHEGQSARVEASPAV
jgi:MFS family permease